MAGRLKEFLPFWEQITSDRWVLNILRRGYSIERLHIPPFTVVQSTRPPTLGTDLLSSEVAGLLQKCAVVPVPLDQGRDGYLSTYFIVPKKDGGL